MKFNYFRIVITLLASTGAFFAYICKLNLSLIINDMVIKDKPQLAGEPKQSVDTNTAKALYSNSFIHTEDHTLAWFSGRIRPQRSLVVKTYQNKTHKVLKQMRNVASTLEIKIDVSSVDKKTGNKSNPQSSDGSKTEDKNSDDVKVELDQDLLNWNEDERNSLLGAFFLGYVVSQVPSARAAEIFGAKSLFLITGFGAALCSLVFPYAARCTSSIWPAYVVRLIMGASQGALFPGCYVLLCEWLPANERSKWLPWPSTASRFGVIVMSFVLPEILLNYGWDSCFYICGTAALIWCFVFILFGSNSPNQSYWISKQELIYIESHMEPRVGTLTQQQTISASGFTINESVEPLAIPSVSWKKLAGNKAILILTLVMFTSEWSNMLLLIKLPGFLCPVFKMDTKEIGFWSSVLVAVYCIQYPLTGWFATQLENSDNEWLSSLRVRKIFEAAAQAMQGIGCFIIAFSADKTIVIGALSLMMLGRATVGGGQCLMPPELSRDYPGTVFAYANTLANVAGFVGPTIVGWLVSNPEDHSSWFSIWIGSGLLFLISGVIFCLFADNRPQNYCRKSKASKTPNKSLSLAQLTMDTTREPEIFKMEAFSRVSSEPNARTNAPRLSSFESKAKESKLI